jgi:hypothetical protein
MPAVTNHGPSIATATPAKEAREPHECLAARAGWTRGRAGGGHAAVWNYTMGHTGHGSTENSWEPNLLIKSKRKPVLKITHQIKD